jgi:hypothetical protein
MEKKTYYYVNWDNYAGCGNVREVQLTDEEYANWGKYPHLYTKESEAEHYLDWCYYD